MKTTLAANIRALRRQRSLTQEQLAGVLGVTPGAVHKWEAELSVPELQTIMEMAEYFDVSTDSLLGYRIGENSLAAIEERMSACCRTGDRAALAEAENALRKYPNSFRVVYRCAQVFYVFGSQGHDKALLRRALELYEKALLLQEQNTAPQISASTIYGNIGGVHILTGEEEEGVEILKKHNAGGMFDDAISDTLAVFLHRPEEARPYLFSVLLRIVSHIQSAAAGYAFLYAGRGDHASEKEVVLWALGTLDGLRKGDGPDFLDKTRAVLTVLLSHAQLTGGDKEAARETLRKAAALVRTFDLAPYYGVEGLRFAESEENGSMHDGLGGTAAESVAFLLEKIGHSGLSALWEEVFCGPAGVR